ncbi:peptide-methionine (S)-S-oxide reductase MsrA [Trinickia soli]|uniref:Peptide methionine sulfoxide reductase MsrA n=1 Tax=Trinickia soli TaxID=380675 RepID=A0A2N7WBE9_9BURK|nr:peptide-methionine (S)-S-oxide reductase MsrA [Trinickia soli]KAA0087490.1 peptide-methionine (S)-S-oxide reductase [Paraburkholderia sp. T12-10]PMS26728.1 peptide-methionine (S)-S-oxide reductase [Trinickia soli]CAB3719785.1 Peptide methionine sulfoxide reductase MsrA 2 [Trinickia soli]
MSQTTSEIATLGGGCFWCLEAVYADVEGVKSVESGYAGGAVAHPTYEQVCDGGTGHAEVVKVEFDPTRISYHEILQIFFSIHDPTQLNRQGNDVGEQYRSVVFTHDERQRDIALEAISALARDNVYDAPIVTEVMPLNDNYWPAEAYHQRYFAQHPEQGYCAFVVAPKVAKFRAKFASWMRPGA